MIKAVAAALVLIAGAAVVLWFGNTLNSWVLGGLIGGLAALLLSIPISLTLFSYLSHRHDEQLRAEAEQAEFEQMYEYEQIPARRGSYAVEEYVDAEDEEFWDEEEYYQQPRRLPQPAPQRLPEPRPAPNRQAVSRRGTYDPLPKPGTRNTQAARNQDAGSRRATTRNLNYPGFPGYEPGSVLRHHKSAALRAARIEKAQQYEEDEEVLPTHVSRRIPSMRPGQELPDQYEQIPRPRPSRQLPPENPRTQRRPRVVESKTSRNDLPPRSLPPEGGSSARGRSAYLDDPETESLGDYYPETGSMRRPTGQMTRNPRFDGEVPHTEKPSENLGRPLVRRAPYTYDDDPIRQEMSQQLHPPKVRRSSRLEPQQYDQE
ncbi:MAG: hypothetical protein H0V70_14060 [Ktedonobacteraceae bacterium]|nr:hypothetical protein [Ktedonobacteraceae bacterium]